MKNMNKATNEYFDFLANTLSFANYFIAGNGNTAEAEKNPEENTEKFLDMLAGSRTNLAA